MNKSIWVLEKTLTNKSLFYAGNGSATFDLSLAFRFGTEQLALEFIKRTAKDQRISYFRDYVPTEYRLEKVKK